MKPCRIASSLLTVSLLLGAPSIAFAHVGHGDEFQAEGGVNRVAVNAETDSMLGINVSPIESATDGSAAVLIPVTALVDDNGKEMVFVQYENFYEPVPVTTGASQGELIEVAEGLSVGEQLVTQGGLSLYAESRKTQPAQASASPATAESLASTSGSTHAQADAQGLPHSHDAAGNLTAQAGESAPDSVPDSAPDSDSGFPMGILAAVVAVGALLVGAITVMGKGRKNKGVSSYKKGDY
ncbi:MAG: cobalt transporter [Phormidesmis sp.]